MERLKQTSERMNELGYQDLLSKCIQKGFLEGGYSKSSTALQAKAEPAVGTGRLENSTSGSREDTSGAAEGPLVESDSGHRLLTGMDGTPMDKRRFFSVATPRSAGIGHMRGRALLPKDSKIDGFPRSFLKSRGMGTKIPPSTFSFRSLLEGAIIASRDKPPTSTDMMAESDVQGAPNVEAQKDCVSDENHPLSDERNLVGESHDGVVSSRSTSQPCRDEKTLSSKGVELWKGKGNFTLRASYSGPLSGDTVGDSRAHVSYSSLLQAQLGDVDKVRTETPQKTVGPSVVGVETHSSLLNLQSQSTEGEGGFASFLEMKSSLLSTGARQASFPAADAVFIGEQISNIHHSDKPSHASAVAEPRSTDKFLKRDVSESRRATAVLATPVPTRVEEDVSRAEIVVGRGSSLVADSMCTDNETLSVEIPEGDYTALAGDESRSADILSERGATDSSEAAVIPVSVVPRRTEQCVSPAEVVGYRGSFVVADSVCIDEMMSDVQLFEELSCSLAVDESRFAENVLNRDTIDSSTAAAVLAPPAPTKADEDDARAIVAVERVTIGMADSLSTDEKMLNVQLSEEPPATFGVDESRSAVDVLDRDVLDSSEATVAVPKLLVFTIIEKADTPVELEPACCVVAASTCANDDVSGVQLPEKLLRDLVLDETRSAEVVSERVIIDPSEAAAVAVSPVPLRTEEVTPIEGSVAGLMDNGEKISDVLVSVEQLHNLALDGSRSADNVFIELAEGAGDSASPVPRLQEEDISMSKAVVEKELGHCGDAVLDTEPDKGPLRSSHLIGDRVLEERIKSSSQCWKTVVDRLEGQVDLVNAGTTLDLAFQASHMEMGGNGDSVGVRESTVCDARIECGVGSISESDKAVSSDNARANLSVERDLLLQLVDASSNETLHSNEVRDTSKVVECSRQAALKETESETALFFNEQKDEDNSCQIQALEDFMGQDAGATDVHSMGGDYGNDPQRSCVGCVEVKSTTVSPHDDGNFVGSGRICNVVRDQMVCLKEDKVEQVKMLGGPEGSSEVVNRSELELYKTHALVGEVPEMQILVSQYLESRAVNMGLAFSRTGHESQKNSSPKLPPVESDRFRNEAERVPESHVGEILSGVSDSGNSGDPVDQVLSTDPDAIRKALRQVFSRDSDATISDSLESAQGTEAELVAGKEVQSPLVIKSEGRHSRHVDDLKDISIRHLEDLETPRTRHLDLLDENEEQPLSSPLNGILHDQLVGAEIRPYKKKGRPRAYNHEKAIRGTGRLFFHPSGSKRKSQLQKGGNRCRRNRHIYPDQPVPVFIEGRDEGFEEADGSSFLHWLAHQNEPNAVSSPASGKRIRKHGQELVKSIIAIPSFRVVSEYEENQQEVEKRRKLGMQPQPVSSSCPTLVSSSTVQPSEYDMDDEDERWLHAWNKQLAQGGLKQPISEDKFEEIIEYFERRYTEMDLSAAGGFPGFPRCGKSLAEPVPNGSLLRTCPSRLGLLSTNPATLCTPVSRNSPRLDLPAARSGHSPWTGGLTDVLSSRRQALVSSSNRVGSIEKSAASPASTVRFHSLISENERNISNSVVDALCERPSEASLRKPFESFALPKLFDDCCICNGGEDDENNPVYTCKRCMIHVHQSCYGIREKFRDDEGRVIAPSNWCCRKCEAVAVGRAQPNVSCALCRKRGGALKPTVVARKWAHVACALYTNETFFVDPDAMEPIDGIAAVAARAQERQERCGLCGVKRGICSLCAVKDCRTPFHISCGVSQGASFELRQSKQKVVGVRSFCPRHARTTAMDSGPSAELKDRQMLSSSTSESTASATASGSISTASSLDDREEEPSRQSISHPDGSFEESAGRDMNVNTNIADLTDNVTGVNGKGVEDAGRERPKGIRFTLKRRWDESCAQALKDAQKKYGHGTGVCQGKVDAPGCKSTWHVVGPGQKVKKIKFKFGKLAQNMNSDSSSMLVQQERIGSDDLLAEKTYNTMLAVGEACGDAGVYKKDAEFVKGLSEDSFAKEVKELMILEEAMKSGVAPGYIMREAFVYWRTKRAVVKGSLLCELQHEQWLRFQGIFNKDGSDEERVATGKMGSPLRVPQAQQLSTISTEKALEMAKEIRMQLERVRLMAQIVVQREKLKYNHQLMVGSIASSELNRAEEISEERHCVWCPSNKTLLKCGTCPRSFCFNCFKHRKGFGVKGWMAAMKQPRYICKYCREFSSKLAGLSNNLDPAPKKVGENEDVSTPGNRCGPAIQVVSSTPVITSEAIAGVVSTFVTSSKHVGEGRGNGMGKGRVEGRNQHSSGSGLLRVAEGVVLANARKGVIVTKGREKGLGIGRGKGNSWTASDDPRLGSSTRGSVDGVRNQSKPCHIEDGLNKFLSSSHNQLEYSSFETTLRKLKILSCTNTDPHQEVVTSSDEIPSGDIVPGYGMNGSEGVTPSTTIGGNVSVTSSPGSGPALLVYKKRKLILGASSESPPSAYHFGDQPCSLKWLENGTSVYSISSPRWVANADGAATG